MSSAATYVFLELGTTAFEDEASKRDAKIMEVRLVAIRRDRFLDAGAFSWPPGQEFPKEEYLAKLSLRHRQRYPTDPCDFLFDHFDENCFKIIDDYLNNLTDLVYLIAHSGYDFDFFLLKRDLNALGMSFTKDIMCADTFYTFYDILHHKDKLEESEENQEEWVYEDPPATKLEVMVLRQVNADRVYGKGYPWNSWTQKFQYGLRAVYERELGVTARDSTPRIRCDQMMEVALKWSKQFVAWVDRNHSSFAEHVRPLVGNKGTGKIKVEASGGQGAKVKIEASGDNDEVPHVVNMACAWKRVCLSPFSVAMRKAERMEWKHLVAELTEERDEQYFLMKEAY